MIEAIFFDQDDTVVNTKAVAILAYRAAVDYLAQKMSKDKEELWLKWRGVVEKHKASLDPRVRSLSFSLGKICENENWVEGAIACLEVIIKNKIELNSGVRDFFEADKRKIKYILTTEDHPNLLEIKLNKFKMRDKFDLVIGNIDTGSMKPNLKYYELAWKKFKLDPKKCIYVGDKYEKDCEIGAQKGGITVLFGNKDKRADFQIKDFRELKEIVEKYY